MVPSDSITQFHSLSDNASKNSESSKVSFKTPRLSTFFLLGLLSAVFSCLAMHLATSLVAFYAPGAIFGLVVMAPWCQACRIHPILTVFTVLLSPLGYAVTIWAFWSPVGWFAGGLGAAVMLLPVFFSGKRKAIQGAVLACLVSTLLTPLFFVALVSLWIVGVWQIGIAECLAMGAEFEG